MAQGAWQVLVRLTNSLPYERQEVIKLQELDSTDKRILKALDEDPRAPIMVLAQRLGLARGTVQSRLERITASGARTTSTACPRKSGCAPGSYAPPPACSFARSSPTGPRGCWAPDPARSLEGTIPAGRRWISGSSSPAWTSSVPPPAGTSVRHRRSAGMPAGPPL